MPLLLLLLACPRSQAPTETSPQDPPSRCAAGEASACLEWAALARWQWAVSALDTEKGEDLPAWHRLDQARYLVERACELGDLAACVDVGQYREACRAGDAASCARAPDEGSLEWYPWLEERCAAGDEALCQRLHGSTQGVEVQVLPLPPGGEAFYLPDGSLAALTRRGPAWLGPQGWQLGRATGFQLPELEAAPVGEALVIQEWKGEELWSGWPGQRPRYPLPYLLVGPQGSKVVTPLPNQGPICKFSGWNSDGIGVGRLASSQRGDCTAASPLVAIRAEDGEITELTALTSALPSRAVDLAISRGWVAATDKKLVARARIEQVDGQLTLGPVETHPLTGAYLAVSDTGAVAVWEVDGQLAVWTDTVTELPAGSDPIFAGNRLAVAIVGGTRAWDLAAGQDWATRGITLPHSGNRRFDPTGRELLIHTRDQHGLLRVRLAPEAPAQPPPAPPWWSSLEIEAAPDLGVSGRWSRREAPQQPVLVPITPPFAAKVVDARGDPVGGATIVWGKAKVVGVTGPDGTWRWPDYAPGMEHQAFVRVHGVDHHWFLQDGPVLQMQLIPPLQVKGLPGDQVYFVREGALMWEEGLTARADKQGVIEAPILAPGAWTAWLVRDGRLYRAEVTVGAEPELAPDWVAVPVRPVRFVDGDGVPIPGLKVNLSLFEADRAWPMPSQTDVEGVLEIPRVQGIIASFDHAFAWSPDSLPGFGPVAPEALPEEITVLGLGEHVRRMNALGQEVQAHCGSVQDRNLVFFPEGALYARSGPPTNRGPSICVRPPDPTRVPPSSPPDLAQALEGQWIDAFPGASSTFTLEGEPGIGWRVLERGPRGPLTAVIPASETRAVRWSTNIYATDQRYQVLERR